MSARLPCAEDRWAALRGRMLPLPGGRVLLGLSGGADSVALTRLLLPLRDEGLLSPEAVHVNHGLRGAEADGDEAFVRALCEREGIPLHVFRAELGARRDENAAREARYGCFAACLRETGIRQLVLAHHRDDQAETFLLRLLRGAGPEGLGCMAPVEERGDWRILRPLLAVSGQELRDALRQSGIPWREDGSNAEDGYLRNRVRHLLLPEMERLAPGAAERIARAAELLREEGEALATRAEEICMRAGPDWIEAAALLPLTEAERARVLRLWWKRGGPTLAEHALSYAQTRSLAALTEAAPGTAVNLPGGWRAERGRRHLHLLPPGRACPAPVAYDPAGVTLAGIALRTGPSQGHPGNGKRAQEVPAAFVAGCVVRTRQPGDRIAPFGMKGEKSLQDYLTDRKVDRAWRDRIPLLCRGSEVLLVAGVGAGRIPPWQTEEKSIRLSWCGDMPWETEEERKA